MITNYPKHVDLIEVGPRDGFQFEAQTLPTEFKLKIINGLVEAGVSRIQVISFVHPERVPQMADAEKLIRDLPKTAGIEYSGLFLNPRGVERAVRSGLTSVETSISASDAHSRKNTGMPLEQAVEKGTEMIRLARNLNMTIRAGIQWIFGCVYEGRIPLKRVQEIAQRFIDLGVDALADTTGLGTPGSVKDTLEHQLPQAGEVPLIFHFDTALGGMGDALLSKALPEILPLKIQRICWHL